VKQKKIGIVVKKRILALIIFAVLLGSLTVSVHAQQSFNVPVETKHAENINLNQGDSVNGTMCLTGNPGSGIDFSVTAPNGKELVSDNFTSFVNFTFTAPMNGIYVMTFDNSFCSCEGGKNVTLDYTVNNGPVQINSQAGSNEEILIITAIIAVAIIITTSAVVISTKRRKTKNE
jgi:predicted secreted protein